VAEHPRHRSGPAERGVALITVLLALMALLGLSAAAVAYGVGSQNLSRRDQDWNAALAAAEAGIDDYVFRLNENANYHQYSATFNPPDGNGAFTGYVPVPGGAGISRFRYQADTSRLTVDGTITLTSTGRVRDAKRTVQATLRRRSFIDYLYYTDYETLDPALYTGPQFSGDPTYTPTQAEDNCRRYQYPPGSSRPSGCVEINFITADVINGPLHSNDSLLVCGAPRFNGDTSTSWNRSPPRYRTNSGCSPNAPVFAVPGDPRYLAPLAMPPSNAAIKAETLPGRGGCLFTGPTRIVLNANGTMTVTSPFSQQVNGACTVGGTGPLPANGVIYVQGVPADPADPNHTSGCPYTNPAHPIPALIVANDATSYGCRVGDAFVEGTLAGQLTIAAENNVVVTGNVTYQGGVAGSSLLGLVANNFVEIRHPVQVHTTTYSPPQTNQPAACSATTPAPGGWERTHWVTNSQDRYVQRICSRNLAPVPTNRTVYGAILSVNHSFRLQQHNRGAPLGTLTVHGAIAQRFRGPVGTTSGGTVQTGYAKNYVYDQRLRYLSPPKFLDPVAAAWQVATWREVRVPAGH
jgi:hypothetical protein